LTTLKGFNLFCNLENFTENFNQTDKHETVSSKTPELLKIAQFFFAIPVNNASVDRLFSLMGMHWTKERNRLHAESVKGIVLVQ
jgi:hypothetical protein